MLPVLIDFSYLTGVRGVSEPCSMTLSTPRCATEAAYLV